MLNEMLTTMPLRSFALFGGGKISFKQVQALIALLNGQFLKFVTTLLGKEVEWES